MSLVALCFCSAALLGHLALWISFWNQTQGRSMPVWIMASLSRTAILVCGILPVAIAMIFVYRTPPDLNYIAAAIYTTACCIGFTVGIPLTWYRRNARRQTLEYLQRKRSTVETCRSARAETLANASRLTSALMRVPGNQVFEIESNTKELKLQRLPKALDGLSIAHISDLHFTGKVSKKYFLRAIEMVQDMQADLIAITGDLVDHPKFLSWIPVTLGRLQAPLGVYVILGNHDCKVPLAQLRTLISEVGLVSLSGRRVRREHNDASIYLASNELPWISPTSDMDGVPTRDSEPEQFRLLLAHSPDTIAWARYHDFDLMLAGHTHGGQFCLPGFGPFVCPSRLPLEFASGTIYEAPTMLHVSRGLSGEVPLRLNCRPEITRLVLRCPASMKHSTPIETMKHHDVSALTCASPAEVQPHHSIP